MDCDGWKIVIDNGSKMMKAGFGGGIPPRAVFPNMVRRPRHQGVMHGLGQKDEYVGNEARRERKLLPSSIKSGIVENWDTMEKIYHHTFYDELRSAPEEHPILLTEKLNNPKANREKLTQIMFETFNVPAMYLANDAMLALYSVGKSTGISLDCGEQVCHAVPVFEGYALRSGHCQLDLGGGDLTDRIQSHLTDSGYSFTTRAEKEIVGDIKAKHAFVSTATSQDIIEMDDTSQRDELKNHRRNPPDDPQLPPKTECTSCKKDFKDEIKKGNMSLSTCKRCKIPRYCCKECQVDHWKEHKNQSKLWKHRLLNPGIRVLRHFYGAIIENVEKLVPSEMSTSDVIHPCSCGEENEQAETKTHCEEILYELPDGQVITVSSGTLSNCCEPLFEPWMQKWVWKKAREAIIQTTDLPIDLLSILKSYCGPTIDPGDGIHEMVFNSVIKCDEEIREDLQSSIVLSGMTAEFPNLDERLKIEVDRLFSETPHPHQINIHPDEPGSRKYRVFLGGSMLAASSVMDDRWITKDEYDENGPHIVHLKCF